MSVAVPSSASIPPEAEDGSARTTAAARVRSLADRSVAWRPMARPAIAIAIIGLTYRVSLTTLMDAMRLDTPLAHLALVPFIALALAYVCRNRDAGPDIHDRQLDWIIGVFLLTVALAANAVLPDRLSTDYWIWRIDLLTLPVFVAGTVALLFGTRTVWKYRFAVLFLFLAWPYPYNLVLDRWLGRLTESTVWALDQTLRHVTLADKIAGTAADYIVTKNGHDVKMSVATACSGANGVVGFLLVASAFMLVLDGSRRRKIAWLVAGALLVWVLNVGRILVIFWAAGEWGERVAIDGFHPYVGLVVFNIAVIIMVLLLRPFGLRVRSGREERRRLSAALAVESGTDPSTLPDAPRPQPRRPRLLAGGLAVVVAATGVGLANTQLHEYDRIANGLGSPRLADFATSQRTPDGWTSMKTNTYTQYERFFGAGSTWDRYMFRFTGNETSSLYASVSITIDVVNTPDRAALNAYGIEQCYRFHGYSITGEQRVDLGDGIRGGMLTWTNERDDLTWTTLYWYWPVTRPEGTNYERVVLIMNDQPSNTFRSPALDGEADERLRADLDQVFDADTPDEDRTRLVATRQFLVGFAQELIELREPSPDAV